MKKLFRVQDLDVLSFYDVSTQMSLFLNMRLMIRIRNIVHFYIPPIGYHGVAFTLCLSVRLRLRLAKNSFICTNSTKKKTQALFRISDIS